MHTSPKCISFGSRACFRYVSKRDILTALASENMNTYLLEVHVEGPSKVLHKHLELDRLHVCCLVPGLHLTSPRLTAREL